MTAHLHEDTRCHRHADLTATLDHKHRAREVRELAASEGIPLPMPAEWIATLEALGYVVDLYTGQWTDAAAFQYWPTETAEAAQALMLESCQAVQL